MSKKTILICAASVLGIAIIIGLLASSFRKLQSYQVGLIYNKITRNLNNNPQTEGLHIGPPGYEFIIFPNVYETMIFDDLQCLNLNGVRIILDVTCQFKIQVPHMKKVVMEFRNFDRFKQVLKYMGIAAIHEACSNFTTAQFQEVREAFQFTVRNKIEERFNSVHADVSGIQVNNIQRPHAYEKAIRDKERAREDILVAQQEQPKKLTAARTKEKEAKTQYNIIVEKAQSDARIKLKQAQAEVDSISFQYKKEAESYKKIMDKQGLAFNSTGFLSYLAIRTISSVKNPLYISMNIPENK